MDWNIAYFSLLIFDALLLCGLMFYTWHHLEAKGAKSLFVVLLSVFAFNFLYLITLFSRTAYAKLHGMYFVYISILSFPIFWLQFVYEISGAKKNVKLWGTLPFAVINLMGYLFLVLPIHPFYPLVEYSNCEVYWIMNLCTIAYQPGFWVVIGLVIVEIFYGVGYLMQFLFRPTEKQIRRKFLTLIYSVAIFVIFLIVNVIIFSDEPGVDPFPISFALLGVMLFFTLYFRQILMIMPSQKKEIVLVDDILIAVDLDHYIIDINMSTLDVFQLEIKQVIDVQLEHAFIDYPEVISLLEEKNLRTVEFYVNGVLHSFEPSLSKIRDNNTNEIVGLRLQMRDVTERSAYLDEVTVNAVRDPLTNLYIKNSFIELGDKLVDFAYRKNQPLAVIMIDIDDFKVVNRKYSHLVGDQALVQLVEIVNSMIRSSDLFGRWESDDLVLLLSKADEFSAYQICNRIKEKVSTYRFLFNNQDVSLTVSLGYTVMEAGSQVSLVDLLNVARHARSQSHALGRNRLTFLPSDTPIVED